MLIDSHCHLNFKDFKIDAKDVIDKALKADIQIVNIGAEYKTSKRAVEYAQKYKEGVWAVVGLHPIHIDTGEQGNNIINEKYFEKFDYQKYLELAKTKEVIGIGEVGLDYHHFKDVDNFEGDTEEYKKILKNIISKQKAVFSNFVKLANEVQKPLVIHCWNAEDKYKELIDDAIAYEDILTILEKTSVNKKGVVHSFIGSYKTAQKFIEKGLLIGLNGIITYSSSYDRLIKEIGLKNIILETDAPYLTPAPLERYSRNEPMNVKLVAQKVADVLNIKLEEVEKTTTENTQKLFGIG